ncbi:hypothetical protein CTA1_4422 [Colletotrichum tanaceti]|uniref:Uncharacterized protein n=1 Tax=Colletotrichum tanaceti TaxID=1306861 RepID=A0A4U6X061_9PEZI|nr:hypothetical protein CTA1_4422 [Colletotrichum tanaceti]
MSIPSLYSVQVVEFVSSRPLLLCFSTEIKCSVLIRWVALYPVGQKDNIHDATSPFFHPGLAY